MNLRVVSTAKTDEASPSTAQLVREDDAPVGAPAPSTAPTQLSFTARARSVNRTRRIVRERAQDLRTRRSRIRSLYAPLVICAAFVLMLCTAIWSLLAQYEPNSSGIPDASSQIFVMLLWFVPACAAILVLVFFARSRGDREFTR